MIRLTCGCGAKLKVKDEAAGRRLDCPGCGRPVDVPDPDLVPAVVVDERPHGSRLAGYMLVGLVLASVGSGVGYRLGRRPDPAPASPVPAPALPPSPVAANPAGRGDEPILQALHDAFDREIKALEAYTRVIESGSDSAAAEAAAERESLRARQAVVRIAAPYADQLAIIGQYTTEPTYQTVMGLAGLCHELRNRGKPVSFRKMVDDLAALYEASVYPKTKHRDVIEFRHLYLMWLDEGLTHDQAIAKLRELHKL